MAKRQSIAGAIRAAAQGPEPAQSSPRPDSQPGTQTIQGPDTGRQEDDCRPG